MISPPPRPTLSQSRLATLVSHEEESSAAVGDVRFRVGDARYPMIAILEGEAAILTAAGHEIIRTTPPASTPATCDPAQPDAAPPPSAKARWSSASSTNASHKALRPRSVHSSLND